MRSLVGRSGVVHVFDEITTGFREREIIQRFSKEITALDVVATYAKALDVDVLSIILIAPSCSAEARELLEEYGMSLETT